MKLSHSSFLTKAEHSLLMITRVFTSTYSNYCILPCYSCFLCKLELPPSHFVMLFTHFSHLSFFKTRKALQQQIFPFCIFSFHSATSFTDHLITENRSLKTISFKSQEILCAAFLMAMFMLQRKQDQSRYICPTSQFLTSPPHLTHRSLQEHSCTFHL